VPGCKKIEEYALPQNCILLFGQEGPGLSEAAIEASEVVLEITQFGSTRSINASAAAAITMHEWVMQHVFNARKG
jgi:tRNA G18 (ribose-2'-O)-methylase SpoU